MTEAEVIACLKLRHSTDVFVPHCKDGHSVGRAGLAIMDAWAMPRSWARMRYTAYEVKVSHGDFQRDKKWGSYLIYCNEFYFACPPKIIDPSEVPDPAGLIWCYGNRNVVKRKAGWREVNDGDILPVLQYVLMSRAGAFSDRDEVHQSREAEAREWLKRSKGRRELGYFVGKRIRQIVRAAEERAEQAILERESVAEFIDVCRDLLGIDLTREKYGVRRSLQDAIDARGGGTPISVRRRIEAIKREADSCVELLARSATHDA